MIVINPQGVMPVGPWHLPAEFSRPNWTTLGSGNAQQILEARGLLGGGGFSGYGARATSRVPSSNVSTQSRSQFNQLLNTLRQELSRLGVSGGMRTEQETYASSSGSPGVNTYYIQRIGTAEYQVAWSQVTDSSSRSGGFYGQVEFGVLGVIEHLLESQSAPQRAGAGVPRAPSRSVSQRAHPTTRGRRLSGFSRMAAGARAVERLPWSRFAGNVDLY